MSPDRIAQWVVLAAAMTLSLMAMADVRRARRNAEKAARQNAKRAAGLDALRRREPAAVQRVTDGLCLNPDCRLDYGHRGDCDERPTS